MKTNKDPLKNEEERKERSRSNYSELPDDEDSSPAKVKKELRKSNKENREIKILKRSKTLKDKNDPERFSGDGVNFKAKIIGIEHVFDARGNRMCQGALQRLKAAVKTSGDHKQKIILNISLKGIKIKDEKSGDELYHHPIHKISFISQDTSDSRAFGYVFGCPQTGHRFFALKTEKTASQVVVTLRDLFHTALELKKKEMEKAEAQKEVDEELENHNYQNGEMKLTSLESTTAKSNENETNKSEPKPSHELLYANTVSLPDEDAPKETINADTSAKTPIVDNLLDLQCEMDALQQGITQMDYSIATAITQGFGISFSEDDISVSSSSSFPMTPRKLDRLSSLYQETLSMSSRSSSTSDYNACCNENKLENIEALKNDVFATASAIIPPQDNETPTTDPLIDRYAVFQDIDSLPSIFDNPIITCENKQETELSFCTNTANENGECHEIKTSTPIAFADLDPLGNNPYVDKKNFFQDLKNPKKVLNEDNLETNTYIIEKSHFQNGANNFSSNQNHFNPFIDSSDPSLPTSPPKLPPKKSFTVASPTPHYPDLTNIPREIKNPFNPFANVDDFPDMPPPTSPPPPPPPQRLPKNDFPVPTSPPPPRPPSRTNGINGIPTPPLPKRKLPLGQTNKTWFSFDQDMLSFPVSQQLPHVTNDVDAFAPPLPIPSRKLPASKFENSLIKSCSASNSPATLRRLSNKSPLTNDASKDKITNGSATSPRKILSRHSSVVEENFFDLAKNPFAENNFVHEPTINDYTNAIQALTQTPPLPPKPSSISRPRPSPSKKMLSSSSNSSKSSSIVSSTKNILSSSTSASYSNPNSLQFETSNGTHSSSSLVYSSNDESKTGSSGEPLLQNSVENKENSFSSTKQENAPSNGHVEIKANDELSPDSIFRRKSDPFADDFFLSLPKVSLSNDGSSAITNALMTNGVKEHCEDLEAPT